MKNPMKLAKITLLAAVCAFTFSASAETLDYAGLEGHVTKTEHLYQNKYLTYYKVTNTSSKTLSYKIHIRYADGTTHTWDSTLGPRQNNIMYLETSGVRGASASVYRSR